MIKYTQASIKALFSAYEKCAAIADAAQAACKATYPACEAEYQQRMDSSREAVTNAEMYLTVAISGGRDEEYIAQLKNENATARNEEEAWQAKLTKEHDYVQKNPAVQAQYAAHIKAVLQLDDALVARATAEQALRQLFDVAFKNVDLRRQLVAYREQAAYRSLDWSLAFPTAVTA